MIIRAFITHKKAEKFADCQDRFGVSTDTKSLAVSDGMGSSWQQKIWAQIIVDAFTQQQDWLPNKETIKPLCYKWKEQVITFIENLKETNAPESMIFRNERSLAEGRSAGATFVGIRFQDNNWNGCVLGDSCLVEWDGAKAVFHTSQDVDAFDSYPDYFDSIADKEGRGTPKEISGTLEKSGCLLLVSDPFSEFLLKQERQGNIRKYIEQLLLLNSHDDFEKLVCMWRNEGMHNDDTTLVIVQNDGKDEFSLDHIDKLDVLKEEESRNKEIEESRTNSYDDNQKQPSAPKEPFSHSEDEKDFITEMIEWLDQILKKNGVRSKARKSIKKSLDSFFRKITKR